MNVVWNGDTESITIREVTFAFAEPVDLTKNPELAEKVMGIDGFERVPKPSRKKVEGK